jgi:hypothetical protein
VNMSSALTLYDGREPSFIRARRVWTTTLLTEIETRIGMVEWKTQNKIPEPSFH